MSDRRGRLESQPFSHRVRASGQVEIHRGGRMVCVIGGGAATKLGRKLESASDEQAQMLLAKASGHYKHT